MDNAEKWDTNKRSLGWGSLGQSKSAMPERTLSGTMSSCSTRWISTQRFHPGVVQKKILGEFTNKTSNIFGHLTNRCLWISSELAGPTWDIFHCFFGVGHALVGGWTGRGPQWLLRPSFFAILATALWPCLFCNANHQETHDKKNV